MSGSGSPLVGTCPVVKDIREGPSGQYWDRLRQMMGPDGLMTYWYLGRVVNRDEDSDTMRVRREHEERGRRAHGRPPRHRRAGDGRVAGS